MTKDFSVVVTGFCFCIHLMQSTKNLSQEDSINHKLDGRPITLLRTSTEWKI